MTNHEFSDLGVSNELQETLKGLGIAHPFEIQRLVIRDGIDGRDLLGKAPTGSGKTLAFSIPVVERVYAEDAPPAALILVPTRELCTQVAEVCTPLAETFGLEVAAVYGGVAIKSQADAVRTAHIVVATPGRLLDLMSQRLIDVSDVHLLVLDEADRMLDMGFLPQVDRIVQRLRKDRQTMFFSATLDGEVGRLARQYTVDPERFEIAAKEESKPKVDHQFVSVAGDREKLNALVELLDPDTSEEQGRELTLVFVKTKRGCDRLVRQLRDTKIRAVAMHGDMSQSDREKTLRQFETGQVKTLIATDVAARGLDLDDITHVINYDPPQDTKEYVHRTGRTGRAGRTGTAITLVLAEERGEVSQIVRALEMTEEFEGAGLKVAAPRMAYASKTFKRGRFGPPAPKRGLR